MGRYIAKQPNGLYCCFSTVVDTITAYNMTEEEYIAKCIKDAGERARYEAEQTLKNYVQPFEKVKNDFWPHNNTIEEFLLMLKDMGDDTGLPKERMDEMAEWLEEMEK